MHFSRPSSRAVALVLATPALLLSTVVASGTLGPAANAAGPGEGITSPTGQQATPASLAEARRRMHPGALARTVARALPAEHRDVTLVLRDLHADLPRLRGADRTAARAMLARPTDGARDPYQNGYPSNASPTNTCNEQPGVASHVCVFWARNGGVKDAPPPKDTDGDGVPDQVELSRDVVNTAWERIVTQGGYRAPLADKRGPNAKLDVYLADIGDEGLYGYCAIEGDGPGRSAPGFCVLDDDYSADQFGTAHTPNDNLRVTAAHEFFHAVQFAYDYGEDDWFMEGTATWIEDEVFDGVNDNVYYLAKSPMTSPLKPLDYHSSTYPPYGAWIFWRWVAERYSDGDGSGMPVIIRDTWRRAQASNTKKAGTYSLKAVRGAILARGGSFARTFARFGEANRHPDRSYAEGELYPRVPLLSTYGLSRKHRSTTEKVATMPHLTNFTVSFEPANDLRERDWRIRIPVDAPPTARSSYVQITVHRTDGTMLVKPVKLSKRGNGVGSADFSASTVRRVELTLTNAGQRYRCNRGTRMSCRGTSLDNNLKTYFRASIKRS